MFQISLARWSISDFLTLVVTFSPTATKKKWSKHEVLNVKDKESSWEKCRKGQWNQLGCAVSTLTALKGPSALDGTRSLRVQAKLCQVPAVRKSFKV